MTNVQNLCSSYFQIPEPEVNAMIPPLSGEIWQLTRQFKQLMKQPNDNEVQYFDRFKRVLETANQKGNRFTLYYANRIFNRTIDKYEESSLMFSSCSLGLINLVKTLYHQYCVRLDLVRDSYSLLYYAVYGKHPELVHWLVQNKAPIDLEESGGRTPFHVACELGSKKTIKILLAGGANVNAQDKAGYTPLQLACSSNEHKTDPRLRTELAMLLLAWGANPFLGNKMNQIPKDYLAKVKLKDNVFTVFTNEEFPIPPYLPRDIWFLIFGFLPQHHNLMPVCKSFCKLTKEFLVNCYLKA